MGPKVTGGSTSFGMHQVTISLSFWNSNKFLFLFIFHFQNLIMPDSIL